MRIIAEYLYKLPIPIQRFLHGIKNLQDVINGGLDKRIAEIIHLFIDNYKIGGVN